VGQRVEEKTVPCCSAVDSKSNVQSLSRRKDGPTRCSAYAKSTQSFTHDLDSLIDESSGWL